MTKNRTLEFKNNSLTPILFGEHNAHIHHLEQKLGIHIADRAGQLTLSGEKEDVDRAAEILESLWDKVERVKELGIADIDAALRFEDNSQMSDDKTAIKTKKKTIAPRSPNQAVYIDAIRNNPMVFGLGPAGTGKTYLAVAVGVSMFLEGKVERLIFCRPAVEAGERLGFLPGDMKEKVDPYIRPIYDALHDMLPTDFLLKKVEDGEIEIAPLAFMRGRTLSNAFVILDEAQNATSTQMKMFLTRMGESSRMVITGDISQTDLPRDVKSGLRDATEILEGDEEIIFHYFANEDVIRHPLVTKILRAYDKKT